MRDRTMELRHLAQADRHIGEGERRVLVMERAITRAVVLKMNVDQARLSLALIVDGLAICKAHRLMILKSIEAIDRGKVTIELQTETQPPDALTHTS